MSGVEWSVCPVSVTVEVEINFPGLNQSPGKQTKFLT